jgi:hypothetical protein
MGARGLYCCDSGQGLIVSFEYGKEASGIIKCGN